MTITPEVATTLRIRELNDSFRRTFGASDDGGSNLYFTRGVEARGDEFRFRAMTALVTFDRFTEENDPHGEHDFGSFTLDGEELFWKIDYYDKKLKYGSPDPSDPEQTTRVLTLMLASEY